MAMADTCAVVSGFTPASPTQSVVYIGHDNPIVLVLTALPAVSSDCCTPPSAGACTPIRLDDITRLTFKVGSITLDSDTASAGVFDWSGRDAAGNDAIVIRPGLDIATPIIANARLTVYTAAAASGIVWINEDETVEPTLCVNIKA